MSICVRMYVHIVACVQVLFSDVYKPVHMPLVGTNAETHCSDLYGYVNRYTFLFMYAQCMDTFM